MRAMQRFDERRYDDVLVAAESWGVVSTADLVRSLSTLLAVRSLHDPLTALPHRSMAVHELTRRCTESAGTGARVVVVLLDLAGFSRLNSTYGPAVGDIVLAGDRRPAGRWAAGGMPGRTDRGGRVRGDRDAPGVASDRARGCLVDGLRRDVLALLARAAGGHRPVGVADVPLGRGALGTGLGGRGAPGRPRRSAGCVRRRSPRRRAEGWPTSCARSSPVTPRSSTSDRACCAPVH